MIHTHVRRLLDVDDGAATVLNGASADANATAATSEPAVDTDDSDMAASRSTW